MVFGAIGLIYSLILAFVIVAVWDDYDDLNKTIHAETDKLNSILAHSDALTAKQKAFIGKCIYDYCDTVINREWRMQQTKVDHPSAIPFLRHALLITQPETNGQERVLDALDRDLSSVSELRRERLSHTRSQMPPLIWSILKAGTLLLILFAYFFHVPSFALKRVYLGCLVLIVSMCMFLIYTLDHPFDGEEGVGNQAYRNVQEEVKTYLQLATEKNDGGEVGLFAPAN